MTTGLGPCDLLDDRHRPCHTQPMAQKYRVSAAAVQSARVGRDMSQVALSFKAGVSPNVIASIEQGRTTNPSIDTVAKLAEVLGCDMARLVVLK